MHKSHKELKELVKKEKEILAQILRHLRKINDDKLYIELGYKSLIHYCVKALGYSESAAYRRKAALRLTHKIPDTIEKIADGELTLAQAVDLNKNIEEKEKKTRKRLPQNEKEKLCKDIKGQSTRDSNVKTRETLGLEQETREIRIQVTEKTYERWIEFKAKNAAKRMTDELLFNFAMDKACETKSVRNYRKAKPTKSKNNRYISRKLRRELIKNTKNRCQHPGCNSIYGLEVDHIVPISKGGTNNRDNLQLLCRIHNGLKSNQLL